MVASAALPRHGPAFEMTMEIWKFTLLPLGCLLLAACSEEEIRSYEVAAEESEPVVSTPAAAMRRARASSSRAECTATRRCGKSRLSPSTTGQ